MPKLRFRGKIILPTSLLITLLLVVILVFSIIQFNSFTNDLMDRCLETAANGLREFAEDVRRKSIDLGLRVANDPRVIEATISGDTARLLQVGQELKSELNITFISFMGKDGMALARTSEPERYGDVISTYSLLAALEGVISVAYSPVLGYYVPIRSSVPVIYEGEIIGAIIVAYALDSNTTLETLRKRFGADFTIFIGDIRVASTLTNIDGSSIVGTRLTDEAVLHTVFEQQQELKIVTELFGQTFGAFYLPLKDPYGNVYATIFMGLSTADIIAQRNLIIFAITAIGVAGTAIVLLVILFITGKAMQPVKRLEDLISAVSAGHFNVDMDMDNVSSDEIGDLTLKIFNHTNVIKSMVKELTDFQTAAVNGNLRLM